MKSIFVPLFDSVVSYCSVMTFTPLVQVNSSGVVSGMQLTITNNGGGVGNYLTGGDTDVTSASGKLSFEYKFNSLSDKSAGGLSLLIIQAGVPAIYIFYDFVSGNLRDELNGSAVLANFAAVDGETGIGITLNQAASTATYSYKLDNVTAPTANAALTVAGTYNNAVASKVVWGMGTAIGAVGVITLNAYTELFVTNVDGLGYCEY